MTASCEACRFAKVRWRKGDSFEYFSEGTYETRQATRFSTAIECRRYAPRGPVIETADATGYENFPILSDDEWCGEFEPAPDRSASPATTTAPDRSQS